MICMKKLKLIYNPFSGNKSFKFDLDVCIGIFQEGGYEVHPFRTLHPGDIDEHIATMDPNYDVVVASGGDGTVNIVINAMMRRGLHIPLGIIPSGTANDFATYLGTGLSAMVYGMIIDRFGYDAMFLSWFVISLIAIPLLNKKT